MKFRCERDAFLKALRTTSRAAGTKGGLQLVLSGVRMVLTGDELTLTATDRELTITMSLVVAGDGDGEAIVTARLISDVVGSLDAGAVNVKVEDGKFHIDSDCSAFTLQTMDGKNFPETTVIDNDPVVLETEKFMEALRKVIKASSADESRAVLNGVLLSPEEQGLRMVTTDSYRLALCDIPELEFLNSDQNILIPARSLQEVIRLFDNDQHISLRFNEREASFDIGSIRITTQLIEGDFPSYRGLIPTDQPNHLVINRENLINAIRRVRLMAQDSTPIRLDMSSAGLKLSAATQDVGEAREQLDAIFEGEDLTVAFNPEYLLDGAEVTEGEEIILKTIDSLKPAVIQKIDSKDFLYLLMPIRIN